MMTSMGVMSLFFSSGVKMAGRSMRSPSVIAGAMTMKMMSSTRTTSTRGVTLISGCGPWRLLPDALDTLKPNHKVLLDLADKLPQVTNKKAFIFSTSALTGEAKVAKDHSSLREKLESKGYMIVDEFSCKGFNTNSFLKLFGGMNKGRPNTEDLKHAEEFAQNLKQNLQQSKTRR